MGHVERAKWDMLQELNGTCCEGSMGCKGSMGYIARISLDMLQGLQGLYGMM